MTVSSDQPRASCAIQRVVGVSVRWALTRSVLRATAVALAACACVVMQTAAAADAHAIRVPELISHPKTVRPGQRVVVVARVRPGAVCRLGLTAGRRLETRSASRRAPTGQLDFVWRVPLRATGGTRRITVGCRNGRRLATGRIRGVGRRSGRHVPLARSIRAIAVTATEPPAVSGLGGLHGYPRSGSVMVPGSGWFGGRGVDVVSNGHAGSGFGYYQCVELVNRFLRVEHFGPAIYGNANQLYDNAPPSAYDHHRNGSGYVPVPGDIIVLGAGTQWGHVVVVDQVLGGTVYVVEQNASASGRNAISLSGSTLGREYQMGVIGVLHARANALQPSQQQPPQQQTPQTVSQPPNLLRNPGFEDVPGAPGWFRNFRAAAVNEQVYDSPGRSHGGAWFFETNTSQQGGSIAQDVPDAPGPGDRLQFSIWLRSPSGQPFAACVTLWALGRTNTPGQTCVTVGGSWQPAATTLAIPHGVPADQYSKLRVEIYESTTGLNLDLDDASLTIVDGSPHGGPQ